MAQTALADLRVVEWGDGIPAPYCAKMLSDLGAEVIKVESLPMGDRSRFMGPFLPDAPHPEASALYLYLNTNKYSVTLNPETPTGRDLFLKLLGQADILVEGHPPKEMERLQLDYATLHKLFPRLIVVSLTPFGQTGPYRDYVGSDLVNFQIGGFGNGTPGPVDNPDDPPLRMGGHQNDFTQGAYGANGTLHAWFCREVDGEGLHVDVSGQAASASQMRYGRVNNYAMTGQVADRLAPQVSGHFRCKDGYFRVSAGNDVQWAAWMEVMGNPEWSKDEAFANRASRQGMRNSPKTKALIEEWAKDHTKDEIRAAAQAKRIPLLPTNTVDEIVHNPQMEARGFIVEAAHSSGRSARVPGAPYAFSATPWSLRLPAPRLGEHTGTILKERLGVSDQELAALRAAGIA